MSAFRRSAATETKQKSGKGGKGGYYDKLNIPKQPGVAPIFIVRGAYKDANPSQNLVEIDPATGRPKDVVMDFFKVRKHKRKLVINGRESFRDEVCSAGPDPHNQQPCAGCMASDQGDKSITTSDYYLFTVVHLQPYHVHPLIDRDKNQIVMKQNSNEPVMVKTECTGRLCNFCRVAAGQAPVVQQGQHWPGWAANQFTTVFGNRRWLEVGKSHLSNLDSFESIINSKCFHPQCGGQLNTDGFICPTCKNTLIDMGTDPRSDAEINEAIARPYPCHFCQRSVLLEEVTSCPTCEAFNRQSVKHSLFDTVVTLFKAGEGTKTQIQMQSYFPIDQYAQFVQQQYGSLLQGKTLHQVIDEIGKPYDFAEMMKPRSLEDQIKQLQLNLTMGQQPQSPYGAYGAPPAAPGFMGPGSFQQQAPGAPMAAPQPQMTGYNPQQGMPMQGQQQAAPAFAPYQPQQGPGPAPFVPGARTNFGS